MRESTTDLEIIRKSPEMFTWGAITRIHDIDRYTLVEYIDRETKIHTTFHIYVDGKSTCHGASSIESGLIQAIAFGRLEVNEANWMSDACERILKIK